MFETVQEIVSVITGGVALLSAIAGFIVSLAKSIKNKKLADVAKVTQTIAESTKEKVIEVEKLYAEAANVLKATGISTGTIKKEEVMSYIEGQCAKKKICFDEKYWSEQIESLIEIMNVHKG